MTDRTKKSLITVALLTLGVFLTIMFLTMIGVISRAMAQAPGTVTVVPDDPTGLVAQFFSFIKDGAHLPAVGAGLMLLVWGLRSLHQKLPAPVGPFFKTKLGGYVLGFGTALNVYLGSALIAGQPWTLGLLMQAIGTGFAASGSWEGFMDVLKKAPKVSSTVMLALIVVSASACGPRTKREISAIKSDVLDCTVGELAGLEGLVPTILPALGETPDWKVVAAQLEPAGVNVGTCVLAALIDRYKANHKLAAAFGAGAAEDALTDMKVKGGYKTVKTSAGVR